MLQIIVDMYSKLKSQQIMVIQRLFPSILVCYKENVLSPTLFSFHINDIVNYTNNVPNMGITLQNGMMSVLKYADDVVLIARNAEVLQKELRALKQLCADNNNKFKQ